MSSVPRIDLGSNHQDKWLLRLNEWISTAFFFLIEDVHIVQYIKKHQRFCLWSSKHSCSEPLSVHKGASNEVLHWATKGIVCEYATKCGPQLRDRAFKKASLAWVYYSARYSESTAQSKLCQWTWCVCFHGSYVEHSDVMQSLHLGNSTIEIKPLSSLLRPAGGSDSLTACGLFDCGDCRIKYADPNAIRLQVVQVMAIVQCRRSKTQK